MSDEEMEEVDGVDDQDSKILITCINAINWLFQQYIHEYHSNPSKREHIKMLIKLMKDYIDSNFQILTFFLESKNEYVR